uniref:GEO11103p1 n=1 Tax=Drosophila melanogaster TaxID=7227 RepID=Q6IIF2_DROME|eukprot:NP_001096959.1 inaF-C [Drosophila melanogaster]
MSTASESARAGLGNAASMANLAKIVNLIESNVKSEDVEVLEEAVRGSTGTGSGSSVRLASSSAPRRSACATSYVPKSPQLEEIVFAEPTYTERFARYFVIVIYLCGLCSLGFFLSIYHIFFWDSRMPPVYKGQKKGPAFG